MLRFSLCLLAIPVLAQNPPAWVEKSNRNAQLLLDINARYGPEGAARNGVTGLDDQITNLSTPPQRIREDLAQARKELQARLAAEQDPLVRQDLEILIDAADRRIRGSEANEKYLLNYFNVGQLVFFGVQSLLDEQ